MFKVCNVEVNDHWLDELVATPSTLSLLARFLHPFDADWLQTEFKRMTPSSNP